MSAPETHVLAAILLCLGGAVATLLCARWRRFAGGLAFGVVLLSALFIGAAVFRVLMVGAGDPITFVPLPRLGFALRLHVDGLSAVFLALAALIAVPAALYSVTYLDHYPDYSAGSYHFHFLVFLSAMYGLVSTTDMMWFFLIFWQLMTLPGYALIRFEHRKPENVRAANKYLLMMQIACVATMVGAAILAGSGTGSGEVHNAARYDFGTVSARLPALLDHRPGLAALAFALFLAGFGIKMGMWPFGAVWLPDAHPAAPSPVSAMLSGVMIKTGVYGLIRYFLWLVPETARSAYPLAAWGILLTLLGTLTLFLGTFQALRQEQTKRLLAFHSIGQVGYILLGVGVTLALLAAHPAAQPLAAIALFGALFHTVNHGAFKALLFLNAGSLLFRTGTQNLNQLGGWLQRMPVTGVTALIASLAIAGVPPLNGFASKWSLYVASIRGSEYVTCLALCAVVAILTSALTLASFVKFFGAAFLGRTTFADPSSAAALPVSRVGTDSTPSLTSGDAGEGVPANSCPECASKPWRTGVLRNEVGAGMLGPQLFLAAICICLGLYPGLAYHAMSRVLQSSQQGLGCVLAAAFPDEHSTLGGLSALQGGALVMPTAVVLLLGLMLLVAVGLSRLGHASRRTAPRWLCGYAAESRTPAYTAHHFYGELKKMGQLHPPERPPPEPGFERSRAAAPQTRNPHAANPKISHHAGVKDFRARAKPRPDGE